MIERLHSIIGLVAYLAIAMPAYPAIPQSERAALIALFNATNGANWTNRTNWLNPPGTEGTWYGVSTYPGDWHVTHISLGDNNLTGTLPLEIGNFPYLETISLYQNAISGPIPPSIGNLSILHGLYLSYNELTGSIPPELGNLTNLTQLWLSSNNLSGPLPPTLGNLPKLMDLEAYSNELTGSIPPTLGNLTKLAHLKLEDNQLTGNIPAELGNATSLMNLRLAYNLLEGEIPSTIGHLTNLWWINLAHNRLSGTIPAQIGALPHVYELGLWGNRLSGPLPSSLTHLTLLVPDYTDFRWNALFSDDPVLIAFLNSKQNGGDWQSFQTVAPSQVAASEDAGRSIKLTWSPILYTWDSGGYRVLFGTAPGGPYNLYRTTSNKSTSSLVVEGLLSGTQYYFVLQTVTNPCTWNPNTVMSELSPEVTASTDCGPPEAELIAPHDGASGLETEVLLSWAPVELVDYYEVYAGPRMGEFTLMGTTMDTSFLLTGLAAATRYEWMISAVNGCGFNQSRVWSFTTVGSSGGGGHIRPVSPP